MKIVFFGTDAFSTTILKGLVDAGRDIVAVVTQPDKINGRNNKVIFSDIKKYCLENNINIYQFEKLNRDGEQVLKELNPDIFVTASYGQIIKQNILDIPKHGTVNVHASLLPKYRGPAPIQWAIINGEKKTGITIMQTELGVDTGDIFFQKEISIEAEDTSTSVFNKLATLGVDCINQFFDKFDYYINNHTKQDESKSSYYPMIKKDDLLIDFNTCAFDLCNKIRALESCYFIYKGVRYKVLFAVPNDKTGQAGEILSCNGKTGFIIATKDRSIEVVTIQPEGKQKMFALALMNSNKFTLGDIIENS
ncbi:MAG: methionyl-tRNA formyltransferase [Clostridia bacterium]|nr:methionyl-tRNA formyltransferase [Clostridia bacterium]